MSAAPPLPEELPDPLLPEELPEVLLIEEVVFTDRLETVSLHLYFLPLYFAVIVALPGFKALIFPFLTVATFFLLELHLTFFAWALISPFSLIVFVFPTRSFSLFLLIEILEAACTVDSKFARGASEGTTGAINNARQIVSSNFFIRLIKITFLR